MTSSPFLLMAIPAVVALVGGLLAAVWSPGHQTRSMIQHFAAGVVLAALAVELLPEIAREHPQPWHIIAAFAAGSLFMYGLKLWILRPAACCWRKSRTTPSAPSCPSAPRPCSTW